MLLGSAAWASPDVLSELDLVNDVVHPGYALGGGEPVAAEGLVLPGERER